MSLPEPNYRCDLCESKVNFTRAPEGGVLWQCSGFEVVCDETTNTVEDIADNRVAGEIRLCPYNIAPTFLLDDQEEPGWVNEVVPKEST